MEQRSKRTENADASRVDYLLGLLSDAIARRSTSSPQRAPGASGFARD